MDIFSTYFLLILNALLNSQLVKIVFSHFYCLLTENLECDKTNLDTRARLTLEQGG